MKRTVAFCMLLCVAASVSGCIFSSDDDKDVRKGKVSGKIAMTITGEPVANVKVMLINRNAKIDTVEYTNNSRAFVDSTVTDANGEFVIEGIVPGNYSVAPVNGDTTKVYRFTYAEGSNSSGFTVNGDAHTVDFIAENTGYPGASGSWYEFTITVYVTDIYNAGQAQYLVDSIEIYRRQWCGSIPILVYMESTVLQQIDGRLCFQIYAPMGFSDSVQGVENFFRIKMKYWKYSELSNIIRERSFNIGFTLNQTPESSIWEYSISKGKLIYTGNGLPGTSRPVHTGGESLPAHYTNM